MSRWTAQERAIVARALTPESARVHLPQRSASAVYTQWRREHGQAQRPPLDVDRSLFTYTAEDRRQLMRVLTMAKRQAEAEQRETDVNWLFWAIGEARWRTMGDPGSREEAWV